MSKLIGAGVAVLVAVASIAAGLYLYNTLPKTSEGYIATLPIECTGIDKWAGSTVPTTADLYIYMYNDQNSLYQVEKVDLDSGADDTVVEYTTGEVLYLKYIDPTDTSYCTWYAQYTVPYASAANIEAGEFELTVYGINMEDEGNDGTTDWDPKLQTHSGTELTASAIKDVSTAGWTTAKAYVDLLMLGADDDTGYFNSDNFQDEVKNNAYFYMSFSGTGWDRVSFTSLPGAQTFERNNYLWVGIPLSDLDMTRDVTQNGGLNPEADGLWFLACTFDLTGFAVGDNVTLNYGYKIAADWDHFVSSGSWGPDVATITETIYLQY